MMAGHIFSNFRNAATGLAIAAMTGASAAADVAFMDMSVSGDQKTAIFMLFDNEHSVVMKNASGGGFDTIPVSCEDIVADFDGAVRQIKNPIPSAYKTQEYGGLKQSIEEAVTKAKEACVPAIM